MEFNVQTLYKGILWNNKDLAIGNQSLFNSEWFKKGILYVKDLIGQDGKVLSIDELRLKFNFDNIDFLYYTGVKSKILTWLRNEENLKYIREDYTIDVNSPLFKLKDTIINIRIAKSRDYYNTLIKAKVEGPTSMTAWGNMGLTDSQLAINSLNIYL